MTLLMIDWWSEKETIDYRYLVGFDHDYVNCTRASYHPKGEYSGLGQ